MQRVVHKYTLEPIGGQTLHLPVGAEVLCTNVQGQYIRLYVLCDQQTALSQPRKFSIFMTGEVLPQGEFKYIGTVQLIQGQYVCHVFEDLGD